MKGRDALRELLGAGKPEAVVDASTKRSSGAVKAMNLGLQRLSEEAAPRNRFGRGSPRQIRLLNSTRMMSTTLS